ncbi:hypothetical protein [uncultured Olleya sp.]|uniref:hypothetical protein n=1 Tax=uncultured Olleya sp. TaxID=757243 RepID=UPI002591F9A2|nr:hypothetical protein [uncultured Olleya sp.]
MLNRFLFITVLFLFFSCGNEKVLQLPEIQNADITEVLDVSPAYIFYDETKQDSVELNRKNLIISTNWLVNVDKRLTLEQALPSIIKLQEKKRIATMHKNEKAKNYYTCNDTSVKNLGFIDFTDVIYKNLEIKKDTIEKPTFLPKGYNRRIDGLFANSPLSVFFNKDLNLEIGSKILSLNEFIEKVKLNFKETNAIGHYKLNFNKKMNFQDYITIKSKLLKMNGKYFSLNNNEFIY